MDSAPYNRKKQLAKESKNRSFNRHLSNLQDKPQNRLRTCLNTIRFSNRSGSYLNHFRYTPNLEDNDIHEDAKYKLFKILRKKGHDVMVEAIFENGSRCDILDCSNLTIIEITNTEKEDSIENKRNNYPSELEIIPLKAEDVLKEDFKL